MGLGQVLAIGAFTFVQIRYGIQPETIYSHIAPEIDKVEHFLLYQRIVVIEIGLVMKKAMPVILFCYGIPAPVAGFKILEYDAHIFILSRIICPHIIISFR